MQKAKLAPLAISMGEPAGIGPDLILQVFAERLRHELPPFVVYGNAGFLRQRAMRLGLSIQIAAHSPASANEAFTRELPVCDVPGNAADTPGQADASSAKLTIGAIEKAAAAVRQGDCRALVTAPIHKGVLYAAGFSHPGHTEFLAVLCSSEAGVPHPLMMLAHQDLRVVPLTIHVPLKSVPALITTELICRSMRVLNDELKSRFGIAKPRIGVTGLNPHAGEDGSIGNEETDIIGPALVALRAEGINLDGPLSADTLFHPPHWRQYDCIVAMYHDQALIPIKTIAFDAGVNITLGLPIIRTSPDHGTAFALAGTGKASQGSMLAAIRVADEMSKPQ